MKLSRRKIFGVAAGGAIAGPSIAKEVANYRNLPGAQLNYEAKQQIDSSLPQDNSKYIKDKLTEEKNYLEKLIRGEIENNWIDKRTFRHEVIFKNVESLKSVSDVNKYTIYNYTLEKKYLQERIEDAKQRLPEIIRKLVGL